MWGRQGGLLCMASAMQCQGALCWPLAKSVLAEECRASRDCFTVSQPPAEQGPAPRLVLASRQKSSLPLSLNSQQVSCGSQPHHKQHLRQKKLATHLWDLFFWWQWLERFRCVYPRCRKSAWATDKILLCKTHTAKDSTKFMTYQWFYGTGSKGSRNMLSNSSVGAGDN